MSFNGMENIEESFEKHILELLKTCKRHLVLSGLSLANSVSNHCRYSSKYLLIIMLTAGIKYVQVYLELHL